MSTQNYTVALDRHADGARTTAAVREFTLELGCKAKDPSVGFNPVETLLSAAGACITSSLGLVAKNSNVAVDDVSVSATGTRQSDPPRLISVEIEVAISSPAADEKIDRVFDIANRSSTVVSTLREAMELTVSWKRMAPATSH